VIFLFLSYLSVGVKDVYFLLKLEVVDKGIFCVGDVVVMLGIYEMTLGAGVTLERLLTTNPCLVGLSLDLVLLTGVCFSLSLVEILIPISLSNALSMNSILWGLSTNSGKNFLLFGPFPD
jgi:hypothetical protein